MEQSPFEMSGGQMRKIALVSILAMKPNIIILDEPTAGLDPKVVTSDGINKINSSQSS